MLGDAAAVAFEELLPYAEEFGFADGAFFKFPDVLSVVFD